MIALASLRFKNRCPHAAHLPRSVGRDLHGAFTEWETQARALELAEPRERKLLETKLLKECRIDDRESTDPAPTHVEPARELHMDVFNKAARKPIDPPAEFEKTSRSDDKGGEAAGNSAQGVAPDSEIKIERRKRTRDRSQDAERGGRVNDGSITGQSAAPALSSGFRPGV